MECRRICRFRSRNLICLRRRAKPPGHFCGAMVGGLCGRIFKQRRKGLYYFHYLPLADGARLQRFAGNIWHVYGQRGLPDSATALAIFRAQLINLEWAQPRGARNIACLLRTSDMDDGAGHALVTAYALQAAGWVVVVADCEPRSAECALGADYFQDSARVAWLLSDPCRFLLSAGSTISLAAGGNAVHGAR